MTGGNAVASGTAYPVLHRLADTCRAAAEGAGLPDYDGFMDLVLYALGAVPGGAREAHDLKLGALQKQGWVRGDVHDSEARTDPTLVPFWQLPSDHRTRLMLVSGIVLAMLPDLTESRGFRFRVTDEHVSKVIAGGIRWDAPEGSKLTLRGGYSMHCHGGGADEAFRQGVMDRESYMLDRMTGGL